MWLTPDYQSRQEPGMTGSYRMAGGEWVGGHLARSPVEVTWRYIATSTIQIFAVIKYYIFDAS